MKKAAVPEIVWLHRDWVGDTFDGTGREYWSKSLKLGRTSWRESQLS